MATVACFESEAVIGLLEHRQAALADCGIVAPRVEAELSTWRGLHRANLLAAEKLQLDEHCLALAQAKLDLMGREHKCLALLTFRRSVAQNRQLAYARQWELARVALVAEAEAAIAEEAATGAGSLAATPPPTPPPPGPRRSARDRAPISFVSLNSDLNLDELDDDELALALMALDNQPGEAEAAALEGSDSDEDAWVPNADPNRDDDDDMEMEDLEESEEESEESDGYGEDEDLWR